jgi:tRNA pseudouridine38-40 synthase
VTVFRLVIEYDGTAFSGWQTQPSERTVQGTLEAALATILRAPVHLQGAGRTDAGVHALGQVASLETDAPVSADRLRKGLTALCRPDIAVVAATRVSDGFNARFDARGKHYRYTLLNRSVPSPLRRRDAYHVPHPLDLDAMRGAARRLVGEHDFSAFRAADCGRKSTTRTITDITIDRREALIDIDVKGTAFLKNMVRIIAGTLVDVGLGRLTAEDIDEALRSRNRTRAGRTAPAHGLTLVEVFYE